MIRSLKIFMKNVIQNVTMGYKSVAYVYLSNASR